MHTADALENWAQETKILVQDSKTLEKMFKISETEAFNAAWNRSVDLGFTTALIERLKLLGIRQQVDLVRSGTPVAQPVSFEVVNSFVSKVKMESDLSGNDFFEFLVELSKSNPEATFQALNKIPNEAFLFKDKLKDTPRTLAWIEMLKALSETKSHETLRIQKIIDQFNGLKKADGEFTGALHYRTQDLIENRYLDIQDGVIARVLHRGAKVVHQDYGTLVQGIRSDQNVALIEIDPVSFGEFIRTFVSRDPYVAIRFLDLSNPNAKPVTISRQMVLETNATAEGMFNLNSNWIAVPVMLDSRTPASKWQSAILKQKNIVVFKQGSNKIDAVDIGLDGSVKMSLNTGNRTGSADVRDALMKNEQAFIDRALGELQGTIRYESAWQAFKASFKRFWMPTYKRALDILDYHSALTEELHVSAETQRLLEKESKKYTEILGEDELQQIASIIEGESIDTKIVGHEVGRVWTVHDGKIKLFDVQDLDVYGIHNRIADQSPEQKLLAAHDDLAGDIDAMNEAINTARKKSGLNEKSLMMTSLEELKLSFTGRKAKRALIRERHERVLDMESAERYVVTDTETRYRPVVETVSDGKGGTTTRTRMESYTVHVDYTVHPSYEDILTNTYRMGTSSTSGLDKVKAKVEKVFQREGTYYSGLRDTEDTFQKWLELWNENFALAPKDLIQTYENVKAYRVSIGEYKSWDISAIRSQWAMDDVAHFQKRNQILYDRFLQLERHMEAVIEQISRGEKKFDYVFTPPDYSAQLELLRGYWIRNQWTKAGLGATGLGAAGYGVYNNWDQIQEFIAP